MYGNKPVAADGNGEPGFAVYMRTQVDFIEKFRRLLSRREGREISADCAVRIWIERGHAAAFRRHFAELV